MAKIELLNLRHFAEGLPAHLLRRLADSADKTGRAGILPLHRSPNGKRIPNGAPEKTFLNLFPFKIFLFPVQIQKGILFTEISR